MQSLQGLSLIELDKVPMRNFEMSDHITFISPSKLSEVELPLDTMITSLQSFNDVIELRRIKRQYIKKR